MDLDLSARAADGDSGITGTPSVDLREVRIDSALALSIPESLAQRRGLLVFGRDEERVYVACADPDDLGGLEAIERLTDRPVLAFRAERVLIDKALRRLHHRPGLDRGDDAVRAVDEILHGAVTEGASDVHLEPGAESVRIRYRIDGRLARVREVSRDQLAGIVNRLKILSGMDISEHRAPQDGRFSYGEGTGAGVDVRVALVPCRFGERITLRLLGRQAEQLTLERLGMGPKELGRFREALDARGGLVLLTGPTGSGKSTSLYAGLRTLDTETLNVITIEDPVEYDVAGATQIEAASEDGEGFGRALRSVLRHDPDVLMIGEIRDLATAEVAIRASLTGHLVLSTLHTRSAAGSRARLVDMGVAPYLVDATLKLAIAQRLVRRLCQRCRRPSELTAEDAARLGDAGLAGAAVFTAAGCGFCRQTGFVGRIGLFESHRPTSGESAEAPVTSRGLRDDAREKVLAGLTAASEVLRELEVD
ncbi:MAG: GspE/PulE family protein [Planctomycetota bacterium]